MHIWHSGISHLDKSIHDFISGMKVQCVKVQLIFRDQQSIKALWIQRRIIRIIQANTRKIGHRKCKSQQIAYTIQTCNQIYFVLEVFYSNASKIIIGNVKAYQQTDWYSMSLSGKIQYSQQSYNRYTIVAGYFCKVQAIFREVNSMQLH